MRHSIVRWLSLAVGVIVAGCSQEAPAASMDAAESAISETEASMAHTSVLDGAEKSFVVVGYSTSLAWPQMLQEMLDEHSGGTRTYHLLNAVIGGSPVGRWIADPSSEDYQETYALMRRDFMGDGALLRGNAPPPTIAIIQQSLQRTPTRDTRMGPVTSATDASGIEIGADALQKLINQLREDGVEESFVAMHIYKEGFEPEVGNERFALGALLRRNLGYVHAGPDVWSLTVSEHPGAFTEDRLHPNERGGKIMAEAWYRALAGDQAKVSVIEAMNNRPYDVEAMMDAYLAWRADGGND